jgi:hypothetical protein
MKIPWRSIPISLILLTATAVFTHTANASSCLGYSTSCEQCYANGCAFCPVPLGTSVCTSRFIAIFFPGKCNLIKQCPAVHQAPVNSPVKPPVPAPTKAPVPAPTKVPVVPPPTEVLSTIPALGVCGATEIQADTCSSPQDMKCDAGSTCSARSDCLYVCLVWLALR